jgi:phosphopantetheinyl transferase
VLGLHTGVNRARLAFCYETRGRPYLAPNVAKGLDFNLSRRDDLCVIALGFRRVGIDIESCRLARLAQSVITMLPAEDRAKIDSAHGIHRSRRLIAAWTALEARAKATGIGLDGMAVDDAPLECRHFELGREWIGCVTALDHDWRLNLICQKEV